MMLFPGGIEGQSNGTLLLSTAAAIFYLLVLGRPVSARRTLVKTLPVALLAVLAWLEDGPPLLIAALALSAAGDSFLAQDDGERSFLSGLAAFLLAHIAYVGLFLVFGVGVQAVGSAWRIALVIALLVFGFAMARLLWPAVGTRLRLPVVLYIAAILIMGAAAATLPTPLVIAGALLFIASDTMLATEKFLLPEQSPHRAWTASGVWVFYYLAQLLITLGFLV